MNMNLCEPRLAMGKIHRTPSLRCCIKKYSDRGFHEFEGPRGKFRAERGERPLLSSRFRNSGQGGTSLAGGRARYASPIRNEAVREALQAVHMLPDSLWSRNRFIRREKCCRGIPLSSAALVIWPSCIASLTLNSALVK